jgi:hypothetical protein
MYGLKLQAGLAVIVALVKGGLLLPAYVVLVELKTKLMFMSDQLKECSKGKM